MSDSMDAALESAVFNLGLFGYLNPRIFEPEWFVDRGLVGAEEMKGVDVSPDSAAIVGWSTDWFNLEVSLDRFLIWGSVGERERLRTLTRGTFEVLSHTPIIGYGLSYEFSVPMPSLSEQESFMDRLAPSSYWIDVFDKPSDRRLNLVSTIDEASRKRFRVIVESSVDDDPCVYLSVNTERLTEDMEAHVVGCADVLDEVDSVWDGAFQRAKDVLNLIGRR
jgi:hypothetical protein